MKLSWPIAINWPQRKPRREVSEAERLYCRISIFISISSLSIFKMLENAPETWKSFSFDEWVIILGISFVLVYAQFLNTKKAFLSSPSGVNAEAKQIAKEKAEESKTDDPTP